MIVVREAGPADAESITRVHVRGWQWAYEGLMPASYLRGLDSMIPERVERRRRIIAEASEEARTFVALVDDGIEGFVSAGRYRYDKPTDDPVQDIEGEVYAIYVHPDVAGTGVGRALMDMAVAWLHERRLEPIGLWVLDGNVRARTFYERYGFRLDGGRSTFTLDQTGELPVDLPEVRYRLDAG